MQSSLTRWTALGIVGLMALLSAALLSSDPGFEKQHDLHTLYFASVAFTSGLNPYDCKDLSKVAGWDVGYPFVYPPYVLPLCRPLAHFDLRTAENIAIALKLCALAGLLILWHRIFDLFPGRYALLLLVVPVAFNAALIMDLRLGNISIFEQFFIWAAFYFYVKDRPALFATFVVIAALAKLTPILLLGLLMTRLRKREILCAFAFSLLFLGIVAASYLAWPHLFSGFLQNVRQLQAERSYINPSTWALCNGGDPWSRFHGSIVKWGPLLAYATLVLPISVLSLAAFLRLNRSQGAREENLLRICLFCLYYALVVPRFKDYSFILLIGPALYLIKSSSWLSPLAASLLLLANWTRDDYPVIGPMLKPFCRIETQYYCLILAGALWLICVAGIYLHSDSPDHQAVTPTPV